MFSFNNKPYVFFKDIKELFEVDWSQKYQKRLRCLHIIFAHNRMNVQSEFNCNKPLMNSLLYNIKELSYAWMLPKMWIAITISNNPIKIVERIRYLSSNIKRHETFILHNFSFYKNKFANFYADNNFRIYSINVSLITINIIVSKEHQRAKTT